MPQSYDRIILHTVFGTRFRTPWIDEQIEPELYKIIVAELQKQGSWVYEIGGTVDHLHILHSLPRTATIADLTNKAKSISRGWIKKQGT